MANYPIPENPKYDENIRALQDTDPARASTVFNPVLQQMIINTHAVKLKADENATGVTEAKQAAENAASAASGASTAAANAQKTADEAKTAAEAAASAASQAATQAGQAQQSASQAATEAANAAASANAALEAITKLTSVINAVPTQSGVLTYTGGELTPSWNNYDTAALTIGGVTTGIDVGSYNATFTPNEGYEWFDGTTDAKTASWTISRASAAVPSQSGSLTYTGSEQSPAWNNYDSAKLTIGGATSGTDAGSYNATFTPGANYQWDDGGTGAKTVAWSIGKADGSLSLNPESLALSPSALTGTVTVTRPGDGAVTASSDAAGVVAASVSGNIITVTAKSAGSAVITVNVAEGTNHTAPASKTFNVTVEMPNTNLEDNTPATIQAAAQSGQASNYWSVGDNMPITVSGTVGLLAISGTYQAIILGFNHNSTVEGGNSIHFQFAKNSSGVDVAFCDSAYANTGTTAAFRMNLSNTNSGGWNNSYMRKTICAAFLSALPAEWQNVIAACTKYSDNTGGGSNTASYVTATSDKIFLLSEFEVQGARTYANSAEQNYQKQYDYYKNGNSKVKYRHDAPTTACAWWLRSVYATSANYFCNVHTGGAANGSYAADSLGFAPGFMVA